MDYSDAGVDIEASDSAVGALADELDLSHGDYAGLVELGGYALGLTTDGVGTKILVAEALDDYTTVGIDCIAMNANDLIAMNVEPIAFVDYLVVEEPDKDVSREIGEGLDEGARRAGVSVVGGETAVMPEAVDGVDLAGSCLGVGEPEGVIDGSDVEVGDAVVGFPSSGIHSNGLTLARKAVKRRYDYGDELPYDSRTIGEELLEPTRIYTEALEIADSFEVRGVAHITGGGYTN
ncbi:MAG: phosphoribosylformylglycinamidine cyclo-ligase, partial [Halobacteria archaeon]|nr:phosphoribosylformylglycinamidine cyclo-ligase [Halobacteria archaeon]